MKAKAKKAKTEENEKEEGRKEKAKPKDKLPAWALAVIGLIAVVLVGSAAYNFVYLPSQATPTPAPVKEAPQLKEAKNYSLPLAARETGLESCSEGKIKVLLFHDPYCAPCVANEYIVNKFYEKYKDKADIEYRLVIASSRKMVADYGRDAIYQTHDYHVCAQENGVIQEFKECFYGKLKTDGVAYLPLGAGELNECAREVGMDEIALAKCMPTARSKVDEHLADAFKYGGGTYSAPMAVIDCSYRVNSALVEQTYCAVAKTC